MLAAWTWMMAQVERSVDYVSAGTRQLVQAKFLRKRSNKMLCCIIIILLVIIIAIACAIAIPIAVNNKG